MNKTNKYHLKQMLNEKMLSLMNKRLIEHQSDYENLKQAVGYLILVHEQEIKKRLRWVADPRGPKPKPKLKPYAAVRNRQKRERFHRVSR